MVKNLNSIYNNNNQNNDQVRRLNELFSGIRRPISQNSDKYVDIEILNKNCNLHRGTASIIYTNGQIPPSSSSRRGSVGSNLSTNNDSLKFNSLPRNRKNLYSTSMYNINGGGGVNNDIGGDSSYENTRRRQSFNEGYHLGQHGSPQQQQQSYLSSSAAERFRKRNSYNSLLQKKNIEHPSAFPSLLRTDDGTAATLPRQKESIASQVAAEVIAAAAAKIDHSQYHPTISSGPRRSSINSLNNENIINSNGNTNIKLTAAKRPSFGSTNSGIYTKRDSIGSTPAGSKRNSFDTGSLSRRESRNSVDRTATDSRRESRNSVDRTTTGSLSRRESRNSIDRTATGSLSRRESRNSVDRTTNTADLLGGRESRKSVERIIPITLTGILSQRESRNSADRTIGNAVGRIDTNGARNSIDRILNNSRASVERNLSRKSSMPRDYVAGGGIKTTTTKTNGNHHSPQPHHSILRKSASPYMDDSDSGGDGRSTLTKENLTRHVRILEDENVVEYNRQRKQSEKSDGLLEEYLKNGNAPRRISIDSLDIRKSSIDITDSDDIFAKLSLNRNNKWSKNDVDRPQFVAVTSLDECQAVRCAEFNPNGKLYAVGSNSKTLRICEYPSLSDIREDHTTYQPTILYERQKYHKGSIYCMDWSPDGELIATGSNDKTIKLMRYNTIKNQLEGREIELTMHDGTIRDICFIEDSTNKASLLISGGAGDNKIYVTDCATATPFQSLSGHGGHILSLYNWGGAMFVSGSQDKTIRFWDLRTRQCVNTITPSTSPNLRHGSPVAAVSVDPSGRLLVSGHEDSSVVLYDIRGNRPIQCFKPHTADIRSVRFSPSAYYLLTGGYDKKLVLTDLQGDLTLPLPSVVVAHHADKVISGRWHPTDFSFLSTSADKTAVLWALTSSKP